MYSPFLKRCSQPRRNLRYTYLIFALCWNNDQKTPLSFAAFDGSRPVVVVAIKPSSCPCTSKSSKVFSITMSSSKDPRPVVVLTAGGVGSPKSVTSSSNKPKTKKQQTPQGRESNDSVLDEQQRQAEEAPFVDEPVSSQDDQAAAASNGQKGGGVGTTTRSKLAVPAEDGVGRRVSSTGSAAVIAPQSKSAELVWLLICFLGIMASFVCYGLLLEYATSGGRKLHELSFLFVTSGLYTVTAAAGRYVRDETPTTIPPARFAVLGLTSMGSTFFSVRSLR